MLYRDECYDFKLMENDNKKTPVTRISPQFRMRLHQLDPVQKVSAIVMLQTTGNARATDQHTRSARKQTVESVRLAATEVLPQIDKILDRYDGKRLSETPTALGTVLVETTAEGILALADSEYVKT